MTLEDLSMCDHVSVAIAFHSGYGHTARRASAVAASVDSVPGARATLHVLTTLTSIARPAAQHSMPWVNLGLPPRWPYSTAGSAHDLNRLGSFIGAMAQSPSDLGPDDAPGDTDLRTAEHLGRRVAETTVQLVRGSYLAATAAAVS
jgi:multimeric flavodoxin WrbA